MSMIRRRIAERLLESQNTTATLTTFNEADMSAIQDLRAKYNEKFEKKNGTKLGFMSVFVGRIEEKHPEIAYENAINNMTEKYAKLKSANTRKKRPFAARNMTRKT